MNPIEELVAGDSAVITSRLIIDRLGLPLDLSAAETTVKLRVRIVGAVAVKAEVDGDKLAGLERKNGSISLVPPYDVAGKGGRVEFPCDETVFDMAGDYEAEIAVTFSGGARNTVYDLLTFVVRDRFPD